jgi:ABC-type antimicrobial peptide transport system permease subunit
VRTAADAVPVGIAIRREIAALDGELPVSELESMRQRFAVFLAYPRFRASVLGGFAAFALLLAAVGLHGVLGQLVAQRTREIGVRMALGARPVEVVRLVAVHGGVPVVVGLIAGLAAAAVLARFLAAFLYGVKPRDPVTLLAVSGALLAAAAFAIALPARRAARTDPVNALRQE